MLPSHGRKGLLHELVSRLLRFLARRLRSDALELAQLLRSKRWRTRVRGRGGFDLSISAALQLVPVGGAYRLLGLGVSQLSCSFHDEAPA